MSSRSPATTLRNPIAHRDQLADRVAALERTVSRLERAAAPSEQLPVDARTEAVLTMFSLLHSGPFDLHLYRAQVTAIAELFEESHGSPRSQACADCVNLSARDDAAELCRLLLASIDPKEPRPRPQLRLVSSTDEPAAPVVPEPSPSETASTPGQPPDAATETPQ
jgi:hypothetical protein